MPNPWATAKVAGFVVHIKAIEMTANVRSERISKNSQLLPENRSLYEGP